MLVLLVDDDQLVRETLRAMLEELRHEVITASTHHEALALISEHPFRAALVDLYLTAGSAQRDGLVVACACVDRQIERVCIITGSHPDASTVDALTAIGISLARKPIELQWLDEFLV